jgi:hypothetical protein
MKMLEDKKRTIYLKVRKSGKPNNLAIKKNLKDTKADIVLEKSSNNLNITITRKLYKISRRDKNFYIQRAVALDPDPRIRKTFRALENPKYKWRTITGISKETLLKPEEVNIIINHLNKVGVVISSSDQGPNGEKLYTTRQNYLLKRSTISRILSSLSDEIR